MIFAVLELLIAALVIIGIITQVINPLLKGTPFFPAFRKTTNVESELEIARQKVQIAELENERDALLAHAETLRKKVEETTNDQK